MRFILRHTNYEGNHIFSDVSGNSYDKMVVSTLPSPYEGLHVVLGSCNGVFLLEYIDGPDGRDVVWNPFLNQCMVLPPPLNLKCPPCSISHCDGTCEVEVISHVFGIGYLPNSEDYKVLRLTSNYYHHPSNYDHACLKQAQLYSLTKACWEEIEIDSEERSRYDIIGRPTYIDGFCYWMAETVDGGRVIVFFSFTTWKFSSLPVPHIILDESFESHLVEIEGTLGIVVYPIYGNEHRFSFLVLRGESWARKTELDVRLVGAQRFLGLSYDNVLLLEGRDGELLVYDYKKKKLNRINQIYDYPLKMSIFPYDG